MGTYGKVINSGESLESILENKEYKHGEYCHYTDLDTIDKIIKGRAFMMGNVNGFNDVCDREQFKNVESCFALCFATGVNENLPMWQIYSGCSLRGGRIQFSNSKYSIRKLIEESQYEVWRKNEYINGNRRYIPYRLKDDDMYKAFHDVVYVKKENKYVSLKYNNRFITQIPNEEFENYIKSDIANWDDGHIGFQKKQIWHYEKETRLLIKLKDGVLDKVKEHEKMHNYQTSEKDEFIISLNFENIYDVLIKSGRMKIMFAPCIADDETMAEYKPEDGLINQETALKNYKGIKDFIIETSCANFSKHQGTVRFKLHCPKPEKKMNNIYNKEKYPMRLNGIIKDINNSSKRQNEIEKEIAGFSGKEIQYISEFQENVHLLIREDRLFCGVKETKNALLKLIELYKESEGFENSELYKMIEEVINETNMDKKITKTGIFNNYILWINMCLENMKGNEVAKK